MTNFNSNLRRKIERYIDDEIAGHRIAVDMYDPEGGEKLQRLNEEMKDNLHTLEAIRVIVRAYYQTREEK